MEKNIQSYILNEQRMKKMRRNSWILMVLGMIFVLELLYVIGAMMKAGGYRSFLEFVSVASFLILPMALVASLFPVGLRALILLGRARKYARVFSRDSDGFVFFSDLKKEFTTPLFLVRRQIRYLTRKNVLRGVRIEDAQSLYLISRENRDVWRDPSYLDEKGIRAVHYRATLGAVFALVFLWYFTSMAVVMAKEFLWYLILGIAFCVLLFLYFYRQKGIIRRCRRYNAVFENSTQDSIALGEGLKKQGLARLGTLRRDLRWGIHKGFVRNCYIDYSTQQVELFDVQDGYARFSAVKCTGCGQTKKIRAGRIGKCDFCASILCAPENRVTYFIGTSPKNYGNPETFADRQIIQKARSANAAGLGIVLFFLAIVLSGLILGILSPGKTAARAYVIIPLALFLLLSAVIFLLCKRAQLRYAVSLSNLFPQISEQALDTGALAARTGVSFGFANRSLAKSVRLHYLKNCRCTGSGVILEDPAHQEEGYCQGVCPNCGSEIRMKKGQVIVCRYCGSCLDADGSSLGSGKTAVVITSFGSRPADAAAYLKEITGMRMSDLMELMDHLPAESVRTSSTGAGAIAQHLNMLGAAAFVR